MGKISSYSAITQPQSNDLLVTVDVNDTSMAPTGTDKKMTLGQLYGNIAPWQFTPEAYGAAGDGKIISDAVLASNTTLTSATAGFTPADTGKHIMINGGAGTTSGPLVTTITFSNSTTVTLGSAASVSGSAFQAVYGTDDTTAINSAVTAAGTYATGHGYFAEVVFGAKIYILASGPTQTGNGSSTPTFNAQVPLPYPAANGTTQKLIIGLTGAGDGGFTQYWESTTPNVAGTSLVSMTTAPGTPDGTFGEQSVIGGPSGGAGFTGLYANVKAVIKGIQVVCGAYTNQYFFDLGYVTAMRVQQCGGLVFAPSGVNGGKSPLLKDLPSDSTFQSTIGAGLRSPVCGNNDDAVADDCLFEGMARGLYLFDHFSGGRICTIYNDVALTLDGGQGLTSTNHTVSIQNFSAEVYNGGIRALGNFPGTIFPVDIHIDAECSGVTYDVSDSGGALTGDIWWTDVADARSPVVTGAANVRFVSNMLGPGHWSGAPGVPGSGTPQQNTAWRDASIVVHTGGGVTVSAVTVDGTSTGLTMAASSSLVLPLLPSGKNVALTYAGGTPTWDWWLA